MAFIAFGIQLLITIPICILFRRGNNWIKSLGLAFGLSLLLASASGLLYHDFSIYGVDYGLPFQFLKIEINRQTLQVTGFDISAEPLGFDFLFIFGIVLPLIFVRHSKAYPETRVAAALGVLLMNATIVLLYLLFDWVTR